MKKIIGLLLLILILFTSTLALADNEIVLPAGLEFGMSISEATAVSGYTKKTANEGTEEKSEMVAIGFNEATYLSGEATIGGFPATVTVYFHDNRLTQIRYLFKYVNRSGSDKGDSPEIVTSYNDVESALESQYGASLNSKDATHEFAIRGASFEYEYKSSDGKTTFSIWAPIKKVSVRTIDLSDGGCVYIDNYMQGWTKSQTPGTILNNAYRQYHFLTYTYYDFQLQNDDNKTNSVGF